MLFSRNLKMQLFIVNLRIRNQIIILSKSSQSSTNFLKVFSLLIQEFSEYSSLKICISFNRSGSTTSSSSSHIDSVIGSLSFVTPIISIILWSTFMPNAIDILLRQCIGRFVQIDDAEEEEKDHFYERRYKIIESPRSSLNRVHRLPFKYYQYMYYQLTYYDTENKNNFHYFIKHETEIRYWTIGTCICLKFYQRLARVKQKRVLKQVQLKQYITLYLCLMGQQSKKRTEKVQGNEKTGRSGSKQKLYAKQILECLVFVAVMLVLQIPMIYLAGSDTVHASGVHPLNNIFDNKDYKLILKALESTAKKNRYMQIVSESGSGANEFLDYYASRNKQNRTILTRQYTNASFDKVYSVLRLAKNTLQHHLELQQKQDKPRTWILIGLQRPIPEQDIAQIQEADPNDKIILLVSQKIQSKQFTPFQFPSLSTNNFKNVMQSNFKLSANQSQFLTSFYESVPQIFDSFNDNNFTIQDHLGHYYLDISKLDQKQRAIADLLCKKGKCKVTETQAQRKKISFYNKVKHLQNYGIILANNQYHWKDEKYILNFALQAHHICKLVDIEESILIRHIEQKAQREREQRQISDQELSDFEEEQQQQQQLVKQKEEEINTKIINNQKQLKQGNKEQQIINIIVQQPQVTQKPIEKQQVKQQQPPKINTPQKLTEQNIKQQNKQSKLPKSEIKKQPTAEKQKTPVKEGIGKKNKQQKPPKSGKKTKGKK